MRNRRKGSASRQSFPFYIPTDMKAALFVFLGGGLGSLLRYFVGLGLTSQSQTFPWKTWTVNIIGCFLLGLLTNLLPQHEFSSETKLLLTTGLCGGFTTFSTFGVESLQMLNSGNTWLFLTYVASSLICGFATAYLGYCIAR